MWLISALPGVSSIVVTVGSVGKVVLEKTVETVIDHKTEITRAATNIGIDAAKKIYDKIKNG